MFGRTIQQGFETAKNLGTQAVEMQPAVAPDAPVEPDVDDSQPQITNGVASPSQASVSDLTDDAQSQPATPVSDTQDAPAQPVTASAPANPSAELKIYDTSSQPLDQVLCPGFSKTAPVSWSGRC
ncbi:LppC putative lipoprotein [Salmonella bongori]|nr:LppC putative lipoprotein [Salmonella bongori]